jgi:hypothetical protein
MSRSTITLLDNADALRSGSLEYCIDLDCGNRFSSINAFNAELGQKFLRGLRNSAMTRLNVALSSFVSIEPLQEHALQNVLKSMPTVRHANLGHFFDARYSAVVLQNLRSLTTLQFEIGRSEIEQAQHFQALADVEYEYKPEYEDEDRVNSNSMIPHIARLNAAGRTKDSDSKSKDIQVLTLVNEELSCSYYYFLSGHKSLFSLGYPHPIQPAAYPLPIQINSSNVCPAVHVNQTLLENNLSLRATILELRGKLGKSEASKAAKEGTILDLRSKQLKSEPRFWICEAN